MSSSAKERPISAQPNELRSADDLLCDLSLPTKLGMKPGLERVEALLAHFGNPERRLRVAHVGGTSGKGSTATILAQILAESGLRVGLHTKPHLSSVCERMRILRREESGAIRQDDIAEETLLGLLDEAEPVARRITPSWHELTTAVMLVYFARQMVDIAVVEVGLGGTYDSTNIVRPTVSVLTNVGLDHTEVLGDTVEKIASDKVGIIKSDGPTVTGVSQPSVTEIVEARARQVGSPLRLIGRDFGYQIEEADSNGSTFSFWTAFFDASDDHNHRSINRLDGLRIGLAGAHQVENAAVALGAVHSLRILGYEIDDSAIVRGLTGVRVPGRMELLASRKPDSPASFLLDGAHNPDKMAALARAVRACYPDRRCIGVLALKKGHDHAATLGPLVGLLDRVIFTRFVASTDFGRDSARAPEELAAFWRELAADRGNWPEPIIEPDAERAIARAEMFARNETIGDDRKALLLVTGSLYLVGQVRGLLGYGDE